MEPRDIFNYLAQIPKLMRNKRLCVFHHNNTLSDLGWKRYLSEWDKNLMGRAGGSFSVMTNDIMARFLDHLGYEVVLQDTESIPVTASGSRVRQNSHAARSGRGSSAGSACAPSSAPQ
jgi:hypothetical protein